MNSTEYWTDYPIVELGDNEYTQAPIRTCIVVSYDGNKYCDVIVDGIFKSIKAGYIYTDKHLMNRISKVDLDQLETNDIFQQAKLGMEEHPSIRGEDYLEIDAKHLPAITVALDMASASKASLNRIKELEDDLQTAFNTIDQLDKSSRAYSDISYTLEGERFR